jgi:hypothetical protein
MSKTRTAGRDYAIERDERMSRDGWTDCPSCTGVMVATMLDVRRVPEHIVNERHIALAQASHIDPTDELIALECAACNHERGRQVWVPSRVVDVVRTRGGAMWDAYHRARARRAEYASRREPR